MGKVTKTKAKRPATSPEARENQMIAYAINLAEQQLIDGTASSQVLTHYLKLGSLKYQREIAKLEEENKLLRAKTEQIEMQKDIEKLYKEAIDAMQIYGGNRSSDDEDV